MPVQALPSVLHVLTSAHRSTPEESGTHGAWLQHWSRNWQTSPGWMQQLGLVPSQPVGQLADPPPKQRMMPFMSALHTAAPLPLSVVQQFCEALTVPWPPQMLPGGLQLWPFVQVMSFFVLLSGDSCFAVSQNTP